MKMAVIAAALLAGCVKTGANVPQISTGSDVKASYLVVGMEHSGRFGDCPGCELDARRITNMIKSQGYSGETLVSDKATKSDVVKKLKAGIESTPEDGLFMFFYSGHGGQEYLGGKEPDGSDRQDEYLCLYDTYMMDDEIWDIVSKCRGRVFLYFDACHSATMYRSVKSELAAKKDPRKASALAVNPDEVEKMIQRAKGFTFRPEKFIKASAMVLEGARPSARILCWSGCEEAEYSYGGKKGGTLTICMLANWKSGITYDALWSKTRANVLEYQPGQHPVQTVVGDFQKSAEAFR
jgi:hypothetical protein